VNKSSLIKRSLLDAFYQSPDEIEPLRPTPEAEEEATVVI
jgi:hypothetical protein